MSHRSLDRGEGDRRSDEGLARWGLSGPTQPLWLAGHMKMRTLSIIALGGALLTGCGGGTTEVARSEAPESAVVTTPEQSMTTMEPTESQAPVPTPSRTQPPATTVAAPTSADSAPGTPAAPTSSAGPEQSEATPEPIAPTTSPAVQGTWVAMDTTVRTAAEAETLTQTSSEFRAFVAERVSSPDSSGCQSEFTVLAFHPSGFAAGQDFAPGCGGSQNIWGVVGGKWETVMTMQSIVACTDMAANNIPKGLPDIPCLDTDGEVADW